MYHNIKLVFKLENVVKLENSTTIIENTDSQSKTPIYTDPNCALIALFFIKLWNH